MQLSEEDFGGLSIMDAEFEAVKAGLRKTRTIVGTQPVMETGGGEVKAEPSAPAQSGGNDHIAPLLNERGEKLRLDPANGGLAETHGFLGEADWPAPYMTKYCKSEARPGYAATLAHEYRDEPAVLDQKVQLLARLLGSSRRCLLYTGAGLSTSAGIDDYATRSSGGHRIKQALLKSPILAQPTFAHYVLAELCRRGLIKQWVQQNHDGLPQKADVPQSILNEIHGAWFDPSNPVVKMDGNLRGDLFERLLEWEQSADLTICLGTSMSGMNSDRVFTTVASRAVKQFKRKGTDSNRDTNSVLGGVIIGIQCTQYDNLASLRIFAKIDVVMAMLMRQLRLEMPDCSPGALTISTRSKRRPQEHQFYIPYDRRSGQYKAELAAGGAGLTLLDLTPGQRVRLTAGPYKGDTGEVMYVTGQGMYQIQFNHEINKKTKVRKLFMRPLGWWWIQGAVEGTVDSIPVVNV